MFEKFIVEQNTHWEGNLLNAGFPRMAAEKLVKYIDIKQVIALIGVRRSGKSTIVRQILF